MKLFGSQMVGYSALVLALSAAPAAYAQAAYSFDLPSQALEKSLQAVGSRTGTNIVFDTRIVQTRRAPALRGPHDAEGALRLLLQGSGLSAKKTKGGSYVIRRAQTAQLTPASVSAQSADSRGVPDGSSSGVVSAGGRADSRGVRGARTASSSAGGATDSLTSGDESAEIIVTAQKRQERLIDVPLSMSVLTSETFERQGATQFRDFADTVPALTYTSFGAGQTQISIRGVTTGYDVGPTVGVYVDDVPYGSTSVWAEGNTLALDVGLFDVDRVEVLRGPQGTLYGAATIGGIVKYVSPRPSTTSLTGSVRAGISHTRHGEFGYNAAGAINVPVTPDRAAIRASAFYSRDPGYIDNLSLADDDANRARIYGGRLDVLLTPSDALTIRLGGYLQNISRHGTPTADYTVDGNPVEGSLDQRRLTSEPFEQRFRLASATVNYDFGGANLTSISAYQTAKTHYSLDRSATFVPILGSIGFPFGTVALPVDVSTDKFTQEIRVSSSGDRRLEWLVGAYYTNESSKRLAQFALTDVNGNPAPNELLTLYTPTKYEEVAGFANLTLHVTDRFDLSGGARIARNNQVYSQQGSGLFTGDLPTRKSSDDVVTYLANARYKFSDRATIYVRYATGYRPGGPNAIRNDPNTGQPSAPPSFDPDTLKSYEAGFKGETSDRKFGIDASIYYIDWDNIQLFSNVGGFDVITNSESARVKGGELTLTARPVSGLIATGAFAYQNARKSNGERLPNVPRYTAALTADYEAGGELNPSFGATLRYVSDRVDGNALSYTLPDYTAVDLRAGIEVGSIRILAFIRNLFDERAQLASAFSVSASPIQINILQPRTVGLVLSKNF